MITENLRLVKYLTSDFYRDQTADLTHIISKTFTYSANSGAPESFEVYANKRNAFNKYSNTVLNDFTSDDDIHFKTTFKTELPGGKIILGSIQYKIEAGLLQSIEVHHDLHEVEIKVIEHIILKDI